jgi:hypothetical protein
VDSDSFAAARAKLPSSTTLAKALIAMNRSMRLLLLNAQQIIHVKCLYPEIQAIETSFTVGPHGQASTAPRCNPISGHRTMKLYYTPGACSQAPHIAINELGLAYQPVKVDLVKHTLPDGTDFYAINPKGYVPMLELDDGTRRAPWLLPSAPWRAGN